MKKLVLLSGYYGFSNPGDDAILEAILKLLKDCKNAEPVVLYNTKRYFFKEGIHYIPRNNIISLIKWMRRVEILISGGGGLFQDTTSFSSFLYYFFIVFLAKFFKKKIVIYGQSFGPIKRNLSLILLAYVLIFSDYVFVRDSYSLRLSFVLGREERIFFMPDVVYLFDLSLRKVKKENRFLLLPREKKGIDKLVALLRDFLSKVDAKICIVPMHYDVDIKVSERIYEMLKKKEVKIEKAKDIDLIEEIRRSIGIISYRLHALLFSHLIGVPFIGISDDPKITSYLKDLKMPVVSLEERRLFSVERWMYKVYTNRKYDIFMRDSYVLREKLKKINKIFLKIIGE